MSEFTPGTLVRVRGDWVAKQKYNEHDMEQLSEHGYLWYLHKLDTSAPDGSGFLHEYRSLATGHIYPWFDMEVEEVPDEQT
jgi:hypothetical protein